MSTLSKILAEADGLSLSSITETHTGLQLEPWEFKRSIKERIEQFSKMQELKEGQCVFVLQNNSIDFFINFLALLCMGVTCVPLDQGMPESELHNLVAFCRPGLIITEKNIQRMAGAEHAALKGIALVLFTSGTTSLPKGVLISKKALLEKMELLAKYVPLECLDNTLCFIPTYFGHGLICNGLFPLLKGKNFFISPKMDIEYASNFSHLLQRHRITFFSSVPSHWEMILAFSSEKAPGSILRVHTASAPLHSEKIAPILSWLQGAPFYDVYGATEMLGWFAARLVGDDGQAGEFREFWDVEKNLLPSGELTLRANCMFDGYWGTEESKDHFHTGDIFDGAKMIGRSKNVIIKNGLKIYVDELNADLMKSNLLVAAAAFPIEDKFTGERVGVFVVLKKGATLEELQSYCRLNLSLHRLPSEFRAIDSIPVSGRGKISLQLLKELFASSK